jgi:hypothetical protein
MPRAEDFSPFVPLSAQSKLRLRAWTTAQMAKLDSRQADVNQRQGLIRVKKATGSIYDEKH